MTPLQTVAPTAQPAQASTQQEPPFAIAQGVVLVLFVAVGFVAVRGFHPAVLPADAHAA